MVANAAFKILGVSPGATDDEIKRRWKQLAFHHHPDRNGGSPESHAKLLEINVAYQSITFRGKSGIGMTPPAPKRTRANPNDFTF